VSRTPWMTFVALAAVAAACSSDHHAADAPNPRTDAGQTECGTITCADPASFCYGTLVGALRTAVPADSPNPGCNALPTSCTATPTCACVQPTVTSCTGALTCDDRTGTVRLTCSFP
jgi:hypothetical protein